MRREIEASEAVVLPQGGKRAFAVYGDAQGFPVLAFHGAPASKLMFKSADEPGKRLGFKIIAFDRPGYGGSQRDREPTLRHRTDEHVQLADALGLERFGVLAISGGAPYAVALAARLGARVRALALVSPMGPIADCLAEPEAKRVAVALGHRIFFQRWPLRRRTLLAVGSRLAAGAFLAAPQMAAAGFARALGGADKRLLSQNGPARSLVAMTKEALAQGVGGALADLDIYARPWGVDYAEISAPCVLWQGTADTVVPVGVALRLARLIPRCRLIKLEGAGHFWVLGRAGEVLGEVRAMIDAGV